MKMKAYESFAAWKKDQSPKHRRLIGALQRVVAQHAPELRTTVKWGQGCWVGESGPKIYIHAEPDHLQFGFYAGSRLHDPEAVLRGKGKHVRHVRIETAADLRPEVLAALIQQVR